MNYRPLVETAIEHFWTSQTRQQAVQGAASGKKDTGRRSAVTGGKHFDGFLQLFTALLAEAGLPDSSIHTRTTTLPGFFRPTKKWDIVVVVGDTLLASVEFKSLLGPSFGNNANNRVEEALGNSSDLLTAYREGKFAPSQKPWLGWLLILEETPRSTSPVRVSEPHYQILPEFRESSYAGRLETFCEKLMRERFYDAACLILSDREGGLNGEFREPNKEIDFARFADSLMAHAIAFSRRLNR